MKSPEISRSSVSHATKRCYTPKYVAPRGRKAWRFMSQWPSIIAATGTGTTPASFSSISVSVRGGAGSLSSPSSTSAASSLDHKPLLAPTPFILGKRIRTDDDASAKDDDVSVGPAVGSSVVPGAPARL
ncbi:hypothetical protein AHAS_Ahas16G0136800 [Arachis hypogaea]